MGSAGNDALNYYSMPSKNRGNDTRGYYRDYFIGHGIPLDLSRIVVGGISISCVDSVENLGVVIDSLKIYLETNPG